MDMERLDQVFDEFLESKVYDRTEEALFQLAKTAFYAGWEAGQQAMSQKEIDTTAG